MARPGTVGLPLVLAVVGLGAAVLSWACAPMADESLKAGSSASSSTSGGTSSGGSSGTSTSGGSSGGSSGASGSSGGSGGVGGSSNGGVNVTVALDGGPDGGPRPDAGAGTVLSFGGSQDFAYFRQTIERGGVPYPTDMDSPGFFAEHQTPLPAPTCGLTVCVQGLVGAHADFFRHGPATMLQVGLNTPLRVQDLPRLPRRLAIIVDASGSMQGRNMDMVVAGLRLLSAELQPEDQWALVTFGDGVGRPGGWRLFVAADLEEELSTLDGDQGATNVEAGLTRARELMLGEGGGADAHHEHRVIFLSDGMANRGTTDRAALVALAEPMFQAGVGLTAVGVGAQFDPHLLARLAEAAGGTYYFADDPRALAEIFVEEVRAFMAPVAYAIQLHVEAGGFYELRAAHGANQFTVAGDRRTGDLSMRAATLAHRQGHDDQQQGRRGGGSALLLEMVAAPTPQAHAATTAEELRRPEVLARATVTFTPPGAPSLLTDSVVVRYPPGPGVMVEGGTWSSAAAEKNFVILNIYKGFTVATAHHWGGRPGQALADLDAVLRDAEAWNLGRQDMDIEDDLRLMRLLRDNVARATQEGPAGQPSDPWRD